MNEPLKSLINSLAIIILMSALCNVAITEESLHASIIHFKIEISTNRIQQLLSLEYNINYRGKSLLCMAEHRVTPNGRALADNFTYLAI